MMIMIRNNNKPDSIFWLKAKMHNFQSLENNIWTQEKSGEWPMDGLKARIYLVGGENGKQTFTNLAGFGMYAVCEIEIDWNYV